MAKRKKSLFPLKGLMAGRSSFLSRDCLSAADRSSTWQTRSSLEMISTANLCCSGWTEHYLTAVHLFLFLLSLSIAVFLIATLFHRRIVLFHLAFLLFIILIIWSLTSRICVVQTILSLNKTLFKMYGVPFCQQGQRGDSPSKLLSIYFFL